FQRDSDLLVQDLDIERLRNERQRLHGFGEQQATAPVRAWRRIPFTLPASAPKRLARTIDAHPFVPRGQEQLAERCHDIFNTQVAGLAKRLEHIGKPNVVIGVSGGLDSTLALVVVCKTFDLLGMPRSSIQALTM